MKRNGFSLLLLLLLALSAFAQTADTTVKAKIKTQAEMVAERLKKLKITPPSLNEVKSATEPLKKLVGAENDGKDILVILNGVKVTYQEYKKVDPSTITYLTVIKDKTGLNAYAVKKSNPALKDLFTAKYSKAIVLETKKKVETAK